MVKLCILIQTRCENNATNEDLQFIVQLKTYKLPKLVPSENNEKYRT